MKIVSYKEMYEDLEAELGLGCTMVILAMGDMDKTQKAGLACFHKCIKNVNRHHVEDDDKSAEDVLNDLVEIVYKSLNDKSMEKASEEKANQIRLGLYEQVVKKLCEYMEATKK